MLKSSFLISIFVLQSVSFAMGDAVPIKTTLPPFGTKFYEHRDQCGLANLCKNWWNVGCWNSTRIKREANFKGEDYVKYGTDIPRFAYPWMAVIIVKRSVGQSFCTASLISVRHILTARHCFWGTGGIDVTTYGVIEKVPEDTIFAYLGPDRVGTEPFNFTYKVKQEVHEIKIPPNTYTDHDIALIRMRDVEFSDYIRPICLPFDGIPISGYYSFAGWGANEGKHPFESQPPTFPDNLQEMKGLHVESLHQAWPVSSPPFNQSLDSPSIWAHNGTNVTSFFYINVTDYGGLCSGDSGGALTWQDPQTDRFYIMGTLTQTFNDMGTDICATINTQKWRAAIFTKVSYYLDYIYREMNPDAFANGLCRSAECKDPNTTFVDKDGQLKAPCGSVEGIGNFCLAGDAGSVLINRNAKNHTSKEEFLDNGFAECNKCSNTEPDWNYQQWINEITLGSFKRRRYYGSESPYNAFAQSYFQGVFVEDNLNNNETDYYGELTCPHLTEKHVIPASGVCDGFRDCPNAWDENPLMCIGKCDHYVQHEKTKKFWHDKHYLAAADMDMKTCFYNCHKSPMCTAYEWTAYNGDCKIFNVSRDTMTETPWNNTVFRGPGRCPELQMPGHCVKLVSHQNRNGAFRIQDYRGYFVKVFPDYPQKVNVHGLHYTFLMENNSLPNESPQYQGNMHEWIFKYHGDRSLRDSYVTIMNGIVGSTGPFAVPMYITVEYKFNATHDEADVFMNPKLENFHDDENNLDQRFHLEHLYDITRNKDDLMDTAIYAKYYNANEDRNITVQLFTDFRDFAKGDGKAHGSQKLKGKNNRGNFRLYASGPKSHPPTAKEGKFRFLECTEMLPHLKRVYESPPEAYDKAFELCMHYKDDYTDVELHFAFGISMSHLRDITKKRRKHLVENMCKALADSDHIWDYAGKMRISADGFSRMYETVENVHLNDHQSYSHLLVKLQPYFLQNTP